MDTLLEDLFRAYYDARRNKRNTPSALLYEMVMKGLSGLNFPANLDYGLLQYLISKTIFNDPTKGCIVRGHRSDWKGLPVTKSLFTALPGKGLPIGNLTSQLFSNIYLNELDQFVKRELKIRYYGRNVNDFFLIHHDKAWLIYCIHLIREMLNSQLHLEFYPKKI